MLDAQLIPNTSCNAEEPFLPENSGPLRNTLTTLCAALDIINLMPMGDHRNESLQDLARLSFNRSYENLLKHYNWTHDEIANVLFMHQKEDAS